MGVLAISAPAAYVLSRWKFTGGKALRIGLVIAMSVPVIMVIMPIYSLSVQWGIKGRVLLVLLYIMLRVQISRDVDRLAPRIQNSITAVNSTQMPTTR